MYYSLAIIFKHLFINKFYRQKVNINVLRIYIYFKAVSDIQLISTYTFIYDNPFLSYHKTINLNNEMMN